MSSPRVKLTILGLSFSQTQDNGYVLILVEEEGERRIPIIIGASEAQAIAIQLESLKAPRPLTHDLFYNFARAFAIELIEVMIYKLQEGIFYSKIMCKQNDTVVEVDARTSDAVALAVRFGAPIYTSQDIMYRAGIILELDKETKTYKPAADTVNRYTNLPLAELQQQLQQAIASENYEKASEIRDELKRRENIS